MSAAADTAWVSMMASELRAAAASAPAAESMSRASAPGPDWDDAWVGVAVAVQSGDGLVQGIAWASPDGATRHWSALSRGRAVDPSSTLVAEQMLRAAGVPTTDREWGTPLDRLPVDVQAMARELSAASCELPLPDPQWPWSATGRAAWAEHCDERLPGSLGDLRARVQGLQLMAPVDDVWVMASAPIEEESEPPSLGELAVRTLPRVRPPEVAPLPQWVIDVGVRRCPPRPRSVDVLEIDVEADGRFRVMTHSGLMREGRGEPALRSAITVMLRDDLMIRLPFEACHAAILSVAHQREAWAEASATARLVTEVVGRPVVPCCP